jgi:hypothetical protein
MGQVTVIGYRNLIEPPEMGVCQSPDCITMAAMGTPELVLVATYSEAGAKPIHVCATCDERMLRAWLDES